MEHEKEYSGQIDHVIIWLCHFKLVVLPFQCSCTSELYIIFDQSDG